jgi:hypothetical protein
VTTYINNLHTTGTASSSATTWRTLTTRPRDPTRECNFCVASALSSYKLETTPHRRAIDAQRQARLNELAEDRCQLDEKLVILHWELGLDPEPRDWRPTQMVLMQDQPREGNSERHERRPTTEQSRACTSTPLARGRTRDYD